MRVTFTVTGSTSKELNEQAEEILDKFAVPNRRPSTVMKGWEVLTYSYSIEATPFILAAEGGVRSWEGEVTAEVDES